jgi:hypothetical protein
MSKDNFCDLMIDGFTDFWEMRKLQSNEPLLAVDGCQLNDLRRGS